MILPEMSEDLDVLVEGASPSWEGECLLWASARLFGARRQHAVDQVHAQHAQRLLLLLRRRVEHAHVDHHRRGRVAWPVGWNLTPSQPWHSLFLPKARATTVSANAKKAVFLPRCLRRLRSS